MGRLKGQVVSQHNIRTIYRNYKVRAIEHNWPFDLDYITWVNLTQQNCHYCGVKPFNRVRPCRLLRKYGTHPDFVYNGLDRVDNTKGYIADNVVTCCMYCNRAKSTMSEITFKAWLSAIYEGKWYNNKDHGTGQEACVSAYGS